MKRRERAGRLRHTRAPTRALERATQSSAEKVREAAHDALKLIAAERKYQRR